METLSIRNHHVGGAQGNDKVGERSSSDSACCLVKELCCCSWPVLLGKHVGEKVGRRVDGRWLDRRRYGRHLIGITRGLLRLQVERQILGLYVYNHFTCVQSLKVIIFVGHVIVKALQPFGGLDWGYSAGPDALPCSQHAAGMSLIEAVSEVFELRCSVQELAKLRHHVSRKHTKDVPLMLRKLCCYVSMPSLVTGKRRREEKKAREGKERTNQLALLCKRAGIRLVGMPPLQSS